MSKELKSKDEGAPFGKKLNNLGLKRIIIMGWNISDIYKSMNL